MPLNPFFTHHNQMEAIGSISALKLSEFWCWTDLDAHTEWPKSYDKSCSQFGWTVFIFQINNSQHVETVFFICVASVPTMSINVQSPFPVLSRTPYDRWRCLLRTSLSALDDVLRLCHILRSYNEYIGKFTWLWWKQMMIYQYSDIWTKKSV